MTLSDEDKLVAKRCGLSFSEAQKIITAAHEIANAGRTIPASHRVAERELFAHPKKPGDEW